jgi:rhodanese-related sulfurtransferase
MRQNIKTAGLAALLGLLVGIAGVLIAERSKEPDQKASILEYYRAENAVSVSPHTLRKMMDKGDQSFVLVDLRSTAEYEKEHVIGALSIPAVSLSKEEVVKEFQKLPAGKDIITYCYSAACMLSRQTGLTLAESGIYTKHLNIGWNEWRHHWQLWNSEGEWENTKVEDYLGTGKEPGAPRVIELPSPCQEGELTC